MKKNLLKSLILLLFITFLSISVNGAEDKYLSVDIGSGGLYCTPKVSHEKMAISLSAPNGVVYTKIFTGGGSNFISISELCKGNLLNGQYTFEVTLYPFVKNNKRSDIEKIKGKSDKDVIDRNLIEPMLTHGHFTITNGSVNGGISNTQDEGSDQDVAGDQVILDDLIVDGSICVGMDCVNGESFGFDTIRLKENNLRIRFVDTSSTSSFPSRDWQITVNDSSNGGANKFSIDDIDGGRTPFTLEAGAPSNSLYVDDGGRLGLGTSTPVVDIHLKSGNTPTLRLEQDGTSGFTPQTWDVAGNEANFFVRDATNGSTLPFKIFPGAPSNALTIEASTGDIGIGTTSPDFSLEVERTGAGALIVANRTDGAMMEFSATGNYGFAGTRSDHPFILRVNAVSIMQLNKTGNYIEMQVGGGTYDGNWVDGSSRELKENIKSLTTQDAIETLKGLEPVRYTYKNNSKEEHVGFIAEDVPDLVAMNSRKNLSPMDIVAVLAKVVKTQQNLIKEQKKTLSKLKKRMDQLEGKK